MCDDLSDVTCCAVLDLVPAWLALVAERVARPSVAVRTTGWALYGADPSGLLLTVYCDGQGRWSARLQSRIPLPALGAQGQAFAILGDIPLGDSLGCGDPGQLAVVVNELLDPAVALARIDTAAGSASQLTYWRARFPLKQPVTPAGGQPA